MIDKVCIAFTMRNCLTFTRKCVDSIKTSFPNYIILVDDGSTDGTKRWIEGLVRDFHNGIYHDGLEKTLDIITMIDPPFPSLAAKWNAVMRLAEEKQCQAGMICNNDILFSPITIDNMLNRLSSATESSDLEERKIVMVTANNMRGRITPAAVLNLTSPADSAEGENPDFSCFSLTIEGWNTVGGFDENYVPCYFEDNDFHTMLKIHGLRAINTTTAPYYHFGSITQNSVPRGLCPSSVFDKNKQYFVNKFGTLPDQINVDELRVKFLGEKHE